MHIQSLGDRRMEVALGFTMNIVVLALALIALMAAIAVALGNVRSLRHPMARVLVTPVLAVLALWFLFHGIQHIVAG